MAGPMDRTDEAALWQRWRSAAAHDRADAVEPDAMLLAAYAEGRLTGGLAEAVEDWLAAHPEAIEDIRAARQAEDAPVPAADAAMLERAVALVQPGSAEILSLPPALRWRVMASWGAMAASLLVASLVGFALGNDTYLNLSNSSAPALGLELIDPPTGLFYGFDEDPST
jgi:hypothetical protein